MKKDILLNTTVTVGETKCLGSYTLIDGIRIDSKSPDRYRPIFHRTFGLLDVQPPISKVDAHKLVRDGKGIKRS